MSKARKLLCQEIIQKFNGYFQISDSDDTFLSEIDRTFVERYILEEDDQFINCNLENSPTMLLDQFCDETNRSTPDIDISYEPKFPELENPIFVRNLMKSGSSFEPSETNNDDKLKLRLSVKSENLTTIVVDDTSIYQAKDKAAIKLINHHLLKEFMEYLEYKNSNTEINVKDSLEYNTRTPSNYEKTLIEYCDWSNIAHPKYFTLNNYPGLIRSETIIEGLGNDINQAAVNVYSKCQEIFATSGGNDDQQENDVQNQTNENGEPADLISSDNISNQNSKNKEKLITRKHRSGQNVFYS